MPPWYKQTLVFKKSKHFFLNKGPTFFSRALRRDHLFKWFFKVEKKTRNAKFCDFTITALSNCPWVNPIGTTQMFNIGDLEENTSCCCSFSPFRRIFRTLYTLKFQIRVRLTTSIRKRNDWSVRICIAESRVHGQNYSRRNGFTCDSKELSKTSNKA